MNAPQSNATANATANPTANTTKKECQFSLAHLSLLDKSVLEFIQIAERAGYDYVSPRLATQLPTEPLDDVVGNRQKIKDIQNYLADSPIEIFDIEILKITSHTPIVDTFAPVFETAKAIGAKHAVAQIHMDDDTIPYDNVHTFCDLAHACDITVSFEMLPWSTLSSVAKTVDFLNQLPHQNVAILLDLLHVYRTNTSLTCLQNIPDDYLHFVHLCDANGDWQMNFDDQKYIARENRYPAGMGQMPVMDYLHVLTCTIYSLEVPNTRLRAEMGDENFAKFLLDETKNHLSQFSYQFKTKIA